MLNRTPHTELSMEIHVSWLLVFVFITALLSVTLFLLQAGVRVIFVISTEGLGPGLGSCRQLWLDICTLQEVEFTARSLRIFLDTVSNGQEVGHVEVRLPNVIREQERRNLEV